MANSNEYMKEYMAKRRIKRRQDLIDLSGGVCERCGSPYDLEFNHKDRTVKLFVLSGAGLDKSWNRILEEHSKCELLCRDCHLAYTAKQYADGEIKAWNKIDEPYVHGTMRCYQETKCKCDKCRLEKRLYRNKQISYLEKI